MAMSGSMKVAAAFALAGLGLAMDQIIYMSQENMTMAEAVNEQGSEPSVPVVEHPAVVAGIFAAQAAVYGMGIICALAAVAAAAYTIVAVVPQLLCESATRSQFATALSDLGAFYASLFYYIVRDGAYPAPLLENSTQARCQVY